MLWLGISQWVIPLQVVWRHSCGRKYKDILCYIWIYFVYCFEWEQACLGFDFVFTFYIVCVCVCFCR